MQKQLLICTSLLAAYYVNAGENFDEVYKKGIATIRKGDYAKAESLFKKAEGLAGNKTEKTQAALQLSLAMQSKKKEALDMLLAFRKETPNLPSIQSAQLELRIGHLAFKLKKYKLADESLRYALDSGKLSYRDKSLGYRLLFDTDLRRKEYGEASNALQKWENDKALTANDYAHILIKRGFLLFLEKKLKEALKLTEDATLVKGSSAPYIALAYQQMAYIYLSGLKDPQKAKKYIEKCASVKGGSWGYNKSLHKRIQKACGKQ